MADTKISDIIVPEVFNPYVVERTAELTAFLTGGIVTADAAFNALASQGGTTINMPFYTDLTGESEILSDSSALTVNNVLRLPLHLGVVEGLFDGPHLAPVVHLRVVRDLRR